MNRLLRLAKILYVFSKYRLDEFLNLAPLPGFVTLLFKLAPWRLFPRPTLDRGTRLRMALEELGPVFVKFGQVLSTRRDLLPDDIAEQLQKLQDQVPPFSGEEATRIIEQALEQSVSQLFSTFDTEPLASASVAQVHSARLPSGENVVVKVIRPGIQLTIDSDLNLLFTLARFLNKYWEDGRRLRPVEVVADYRRTIFNELDLLIEAGNTSQLRRNFLDSTKLYVPQVFWDYTRTNILVMERIHGIPVADIAALQAQGTDMKKLAENGVEVFFTQVFRDSFFHADMHPGNIFVAHQAQTETPAEPPIEPPIEPKYIAIDCGIVGSLTTEDKNYLARILLAFFKRDYRQVATLHIECGWVPSDTPPIQFETAIRSVCEPVFEKPLKDISFGQVLLRLFQTARQFNMEVQPQLVLLQKTLLNIEGLGRQIYPDLDLWNTAKPFMEQWMRDRTSPRGFLKAVNEHSPNWLGNAPEAPQLLLNAIQQIGLLREHREQQQQTLELMRQSLAAQRRHPVTAWLGAGMLGVSVFLVSNGPEWLTGMTPASWILAVLGGYLLARRR